MKTAILSSYLLLVAACSASTDANGFIRSRKMRHDHNEASQRDDIADPSLQGEQYLGDMDDIVQQDLIDVHELVSVTPSASEGAESDGKVIKLEWVPKQDAATLNVSSYMYVAVDF